MKRPMCVIAVCFALATLAAFLLRLPAISALWISCCFVLTGLLGVVLRQKRLRVVCLACFSVAAALVCFSRYAVANILPFEKAAGQEVEISGLITDVYLSGRVAFYTVSCSFPGSDLPDADLSLRAFGDEAEHLRGEMIRCNVKLDEALPKAGDYGFSRGINVSGQAEGVIGRTAGGRAVERLIIRFQDSMVEKLYTNMPPKTAGVAAAMLLGSYDRMEDTLYLSVGRSGIAHLLGVSGLHLAVLASLVMGLLKGMRAPKWLESAAAMLAVFLFSVLLGFTVSIMRSFIMTAIALLARVGPRKSDSLNALGIAVTVICLTNPAWVLGRGFWYSSLATLGIILYGGRLSDRWILRYKTKHRPVNYFIKLMMGGLAIGWSAYLFTLPLDMLFYGRVSVVSPLTNLFIAPFILPMLPAGMLCTFGEGGVLIRVAAKVTDICVNVILGIAKIMAGIPFAAVQLDEGWMLLFLAAVTVFAFFIARLRKEKRLIFSAVLILIMLACTGSVTQSISDRGIVQLVSIDRCNAALLIRGKEAVILGAPKHNEVQRLLRYLEFRDIQKIAAIIAYDQGQHLDSALERICTAYSVDCIIGPDDDYILREIESVTGIGDVYSIGYAEVMVLGGVKIGEDSRAGCVRVMLGKNSVLKSSKKYAIIDRNALCDIEIYPDGVTVLNGVAGYEPVPLGRTLFGEKRFRFRI